MKVKKMKKILSRIVMVLSVVTVIVSSSVVMADAEIITSSDFVSTSYSHDYSRWASVIRSYLVGCDDGRLMRVYLGSKGYYVEYYDSDFNLLESKTIDKELSLLGGFYAGKDAYYIVSGQNNPDELADVECFRITKYDKNWNRITSAGLYDCNTYVPFDAGSLRMTEASGYLFIRTSHTMYKSDNGYHHQANVTIQLDESTMKITDSFTNVGNSSYGYVSHSFNQFIKTDGNHIVAVDHGDAYPRSLALIKYKTDFTSGQFCSNIGYWWDSNKHAVVNNSCDVTDLLTISGQIGDNTTNATIGGFEISDTSYIVAASSINQEKQEGLKNIYILTESKEDGTVKSNQITDISGKYNATSPYLVKINNNKFMVMWTIKNDNTVYYTYIDGDGNVISDINTMSGQLSDCEPIVYNGMVLWYICSNKKITFYGINTDGTTFGDELKASMTASDGGSTITFTADAQGGMGTHTYKFLVYNKTTDTWARIRDYSENNTLVWTKGTSGDRDFYVDVKDSTGKVVRSKAVNIKIDKPTAVLTPSASTVTAGDKLTLTASTNKSGCTYKFLIYNPSTNQWFKLQDFGSKNTYTWTAGSAGARQFYVDVKDSDGNVTRSKVANVTIKGTLSVKAAVSANTSKPGDKITFTAEGSGGKAGYTYKMVVYNKTTKTWGLVQNFNANNKITWTAGSAGDRVFYVDVKDASGKVVRSSALNVKTSN
jgi:plastocyanin